MTKRLFGTLEIYTDDAPRSAAMNMAIDEALFESATAPSIRFYCWESPALSFGYFGRFADVADKASECDLVRRWTGGGTVFHGEDMTYSIVIPASETAFNELSMSIYKKIHHALCDALNVFAKRAELSDAATITDRRYNDCFANPVQADVMIDGRKVAGAAQRRTRGGLLQQGSVQYVDLGNGLTDRFVQALSTNWSERKIGDEVLNRAWELARQKYGSDAWLWRR